jgi:hypothetical protein
MSVLPGLNMAGMGTRAVAGGSGYRYFRLWVTAKQYSYVAVQDFRVSPDGGTTTYPTVNMTSNTAPSPLVALSSGAQGSNYNWNAFNGNGSNFWLSDVTTVPVWVGIDLGAGNELTPNFSTLKGATYNWSTFEIHGSNDNFTTHDVLFSGSNANSGAQEDYSW